jgi:indolepyruvate ferredoxin oxidoreductase
MTLLQVELDDKYRLEAKRIYLSGVQALVRLPMLQRQRDRASGLNTAGFISGYRGSPLGMYDHALWRAKSFLQSQDIAFVPGLNEDLAATAVWGSQQVGLFPGAKAARWRSPATIMAASPRRWRIRASRCSRPH